MANQPNQKLKLLYLMEILMKKTDASHGLTMNEILGELAARGIDAERKQLVVTSTYCAITALMYFSILQSSAGAWESAFCARGARDARRCSSKRRVFLPSAWPWASSRNSSGSLPKARGAARSAARMLSMLR